MNTISAIASFFRLSVQWFLPKNQIEGVENHMSALRLSNIFFLCILAALFSTGTELILFSAYSLTHFACIVLLFLGGVALKYTGRLALATELCLIAIFTLSLSFSDITFVHFFWLFSTSLLAFLLLDKDQAIKKTVLFIAIFSLQLFFQQLNVLEFTAMTQINGPFEFLMAFALFLGLGFGMNRPKSILIDELLNISNEVCKENEQLNEQLSEKEFLIKALERELREVRQTNIKTANQNLETKLKNASFVEELIKELDD